MAAFRRVAATTPGIRFEPAAVSATDVPARHAGFRTVFTAFHHFPPDEARAILAAAVRDRQGIAIAEGGVRSAAAVAIVLVVPLIVLVVPLAVLVLTPKQQSLRPRRSIIAFVCSWDAAIGAVVVWERSVTS
jgi:hypothetical protein